MTAVLYLGALALAFLSLLLLVMALRRVKIEETDSLAHMVDRFGQQFERITVGIERTISQANTAHPGTDAVEDVLRQTLEQTCVRLRVEAAVAFFAGPDGTLRFATVGLSDEEAAQFVRAGLPASRRARSIEFSIDGGPGASGPARSGLAVQLVPHEDTPGMLVALTETRGRRFTDAEVATLERLAHRAAEIVEPPLHGETVSLGIDAATGLYNRNAFQALLAEAVEDAQAHGRPLALLVVDIDDFAQVNERLGQLEGDRVLGAVAAQLRELGAGSACRVGGDAFAVIITGGRSVDAESLFARVCAKLQRDPTGGLSSLGLSAGIAELHAGDLPITFYERADEALSQAKHAGKGTAVAAGTGPENAGTTRRAVRDVR